MLQYITETVFCLKICVSILVLASAFLTLCEKFFTYFLSLLEAENYVNKINHVE